MKIFAGLSRTDYEDVFRAVGALIDERGWANVSLMEVDEGLVVQVMVKADQREMKPRLETYLLTDTDLERVLRDTVMHRRKKDFEREVEPTLTAAPKSPPAPSRLIEGLLDSRGGQGSGAPSAWTEPTAPPPPPPLAKMPNGNGASSRGASIDFSEISSQIVKMGQSPLGHTSRPPVPQSRRERLPGLLPSASQEEVVPFDATPFDPAPMRLSNQPSEAKLDQGAARAAVVMAHIVAARLRSGVPMTSDDPDLASLLEQVRALDENGIGEKE